jgi:hypothetical protein
MSNTFVNIKVYKSAKSYSNRLKHNSRKTAFDKKKMQNLITKNTDSFYKNNWAMGTDSLVCSDTTTDISNIVDSIIKDVKVS